MILAFRAELVEQLDSGGPGIRLLKGTFAQFNQSVWFLRAGAKDTARAVVFKTAPHQRLAIRDQC